MYLLPYLGFVFGLPTRLNIFFDENVYNRMRKFQRISNSNFNEE